MPKVFSVLIFSLLSVLILAVSSSAQSPLLSSAGIISYKIEKNNLEVYVSGNSKGATYRFCVSANSLSKSTVTGKNVGEKDIEIGTCIDFEDVSITLLKVSSGSINLINFGTYQRLN